MLRDLMEGDEPQIIAPTISVATFNLLQIRDLVFIDETVQKLVETNPDIVAIEEITKLNSDALIRSFKKRGYHHTRFDQITNRKDGEIMFYRGDLDIKKKEYTSFVRSLESRGLSKYLVHLGNGSKIWIVTSQLETQNGQRKIQVKEIGEIFHNSEIPVIFAGDTNIPSWQEVGVPLGWFDTWREHGTSENENTTELDRMDQIWYKSLNEPGSRLRCINFDRLDFVPRCGVVAKFEVY